jgi:hypothetical protein
MLAQRARGRRVYVLLAGGRKAALSGTVRSVRLTAALRLPAEIYVLDFNRTVEEALAALPTKVPVRRFWRDAAPAGGGVMPRSVTVESSAEPVPGNDAGGWRSGYYLAGTPVVAITNEPGSKSVLHYGTHGAPVRREQIDGGGRLVRVVDIHPATGRDVTHRYLNSDGRCWLSVWLDADGRTPGRTLQHHPMPRELASFRAAQAEWIADQGTATSRVRMLVAGHAAEQIPTILNLPYATIGASGALRRRP